MLRAGVLTISDTRTEETDRGGHMVKDRLTKAGHQVEHYSIVKDETDTIQAEMDWLTKQSHFDLIITTGGTGIARRDVTLEAVEPFYEKTIDGFGELFRYMSYEYDVGTKAMLSRASAGTCGEKVIFALPGSVKAVELAMDRLIIPEASHLHHELTK
ncbi:MogA/MoaB family molybdenum cofactor biosynthesis protein [Alkalibacillus salilacus]|uniref:Molybdenum cofactor biosynthesis protein B n=1 Tax=Alkalibacillus salilacus TaxID=284582 RepID=A0ABT9VBH9_9BACI|nr:MogA/MoaB family molybdenum cofactor biosynthesis protein [Alkalibacillus salilacus]MDQ0158282.1 molybdenum cofactor biosynthesis protein B [Alkalibacillus salilacus]